jgi:hypothetical protein
MKLLETTKRLTSHSSLIMVVTIKKPKNLRVALPDTASIDARPHWME